MRKCEKARDFNSGSVLSNILYFSLPYLLSYFLQTLYGMADLFIIGQFDGTAATTAVSLGSQVMHMLTVILVGLAMGTTVSIGQAVGARDKKRAGEAIGNTVVLFLGVSVALMVLLTVLVRPIVALISTPEEAVARLSEGTDIRRVIEAMGGPSRLIATGERTFGDGTVKTYEYYNYDGFKSAYETIIRQTSALNSGPRKAVGPGMKQIGGKT